VCPYFLVSEIIALHVGLEMRRMFKIASRFCSEYFAQELNQEAPKRCFMLKGGSAKMISKVVLTIFDVTESIVPHGIHHAGKMFFRKFFDEFDASGVIIHARNAGASARKKFVGYIFPFRKKGQGLLFLLKIKMIIQYVEEGSFWQKSVVGRTGQIVRSTNSSALWFPLMMRTGAGLLRCNATDRESH